MFFQELVKSRFFLSNIVLAIFVGSSYFFDLDNFDVVDPAKNAILGYALYGISILVMPFTIIKARDIKYKHRGKISHLEHFITAMLYFASLFVNALVIYQASGMIFGNIPSDIMMGFGFGVVGLSVIFLFIEGLTFIGPPPSEEPNKFWVGASNIVLSIYSGIAIVVLWNGAFDINWESQPITGMKVFQSTLFAFLLILPFQRLLWYESFVASQGKKENIKAAVSILIVLVTAVLGVL